MLEYNIKFTRFHKLCMVYRKFGLLYCIMSYTQSIIPCWVCSCNSFNPTWGWFGAGQLRGKGVGLIIFKTMNQTEFASAELSFLQKLLASAVFSKCGLSHIYTLGTRSLGWDLKKNRWPTVSHGHTGSVRNEWISSEVWGRHPSIASLCLRLRVWRHWEDRDGSWRAMHGK